MKKNELLKMIAYTRAFGEAEKLNGVITWAKQAEYMLNEYWETNQREEVVEDIVRCLKKIGVIE